MFVSKFTSSTNFHDAEAGHWAAGSVVPYGPLELEPAATVLNYGQAIFEGLKAYRQADGSIKVFRPDRNGARMVDGARRMMLPPPSVADFVGAVEQVVAANARWVPPHKTGTLYLRPLLFGSGSALGVAPSPVSTFCIYTSPVGNYFKGGVGESPPISLQVATTYRRAVPGGAGGAKAAGNYAPCFAPSKEAKAAGYSETLFVDAGDERARDRHVTAARAQHERVT